MIAFELIFFHELYDGKQKGPETIYQSLSSLPNMFSKCVPGTNPRPLFKGALSGLR